MSETILITGGSGFVGSHLVRRLVEQGHTVALVVSSHHQRERLADLEGRFRRYPGLTAALAELDPRVIYHLASPGFPVPGQPIAGYHRQIAGATAGLLRAIGERRGVRFIYTGSGAEYGEGNGFREQDQPRPATFLGQAKLAASQNVLAWGKRPGVEALVLRLFTPFGPWEAPSRLIPHIVRSLERGGTVTVTGDGSQQRDYTFIDDVIEALVAGGRTPLPCPAVINICSGQARAVREVVEAVARALGRAATVASSGQSRPEEIRRMSGDTGQAARLLGWWPKISFDQGIERTVRWWQSNHWWLHKTR
jgi:nucleoside-diphosphate-sugar epimerase